MRLAINYSPQAAHLSAIGDIQFDLYKCPDWPDMVAEAKTQHPVYVHFPIHAARGTLEQVDWAHVERFLNETETHYVNMHVSPDVALFAGLTIDSTDAKWIEPLFERVMHDVNILVGRYGAGRVILENVPYDPDYRLPRLATEPAFFRRVVDESGCGLLLDVAHARIAALHLDMDEIAYLNAMPGHKLRELHITGTLYDDSKKVWRDHFAMKSQDWHLVEHVMDQICDAAWAEPDIVTLEYGGTGNLFNWRSETHVIAADLPRLHEMVHVARLCRQRQQG